MEYYDTTPDDFDGYDYCDDFDIEDNGDSEPFSEEIDESGLYNPKEDVGLQKWLAEKLIIAQEDCMDMFLINHCNGNCKKCFINDRIKAGGVNVEEGKKNRW